MYGKVLASHAIGNQLWRVVEVRTEGEADARRYIALDLLRSQGNYGWGYKDLTESMGPYYYTCPVAYFDMVLDPGGCATEWRQKVRERVATKKMGARILNGLYYFPTRELALEWADQRDWREAHVERYKYGWAVFRYQESGTTAKEYAQVGL